MTYILKIDEISVDSSTTPVFLELELNAAVAPMRWIEKTSKADSFEYFGKATF